VRLALMAMQGEMGYPSALTAKQWGFYEVLFKGNPFTLGRPLGSYVMENVLCSRFPFPPSFTPRPRWSAQCSCMAQVKDRLEQIEKVVITTHESAIRIIDKSGPLHNPADRDHCIQYMTAIGLIFGDLTADHYEDAVAQDPRIDALRAKMTCVEEPQYSKDYLDADKRSIANAVQVFFKDGSSTSKVVVEYPVGHRRRRDEGMPLLLQKFAANLASRFEPQQCGTILRLCTDAKALDATPVDMFTDLFVKNV
jgi:2-methylcitrate dehydratase